MPWLFNMGHFQTQLNAHTLKENQDLPTHDRLRTDSLSAPEKAQLPQFLKAKIEYDDNLKKILAAGTTA
jgi:hypothetical protein